MCLENLKQHALHECIEFLLLPTYRNMFHGQKTTSISALLAEIMGKSGILTTF